jgi:hypothetical protein
MRARRIAFYIMDLSTKTSRNKKLCRLDRFNRRKDGDDDENCNRNRRKDGPKRCFGTLLLFLI